MWPYTTYVPNYDTTTAPPGLSPNRSPASKPMWKVGVHFGQCIDYSGLNEVTRKDAYPLPRVDDTLDELKDAIFYTTTPPPDSPRTAARLRNQCGRWGYISGRGTPTYHDRTHRVSNPRPSAH
jgi:hypothetical protein